MQNIIPSIMNYNHKLPNVNTRLIPEYPIITSAELERDSKKGRKKESEEGKEHCIADG